MTQTKPLSSRIARMALAVLVLSLLWVPGPACAGWGDEAPDRVAAFKASLENPSTALPDTTRNRDDLLRFYSLRGDRPVWTAASDHAVPRTALEAFIKLANTHALPLPAKRVTETQNLLDKDDKATTPADALHLDVALTSLALDLARALHDGSTHPDRLYVGWPYKRPAVDIVALLAASPAKAMPDAIATLAPKTQAYRDLVDILRLYRDIEAHGGWLVISPGPTLKPGMADPRIAALRQRLEAEGYIAKDAPAPRQPDSFDPGLELALTNYQIRNGLEPDGKAGKQTLQSLNMPLAARIDQIIANMERWRFIPDEMPSRRVIVNIAAQSVAVVNGDQTVYRGPVIVGRPDRKTPFIQSAIRSVIFNPSWHVPAKIARKDILPKLRKDPHYLESMGFVINGSADDPHGVAIDWNAIEASAFNFRLRQAPGDMNSLGRIKFDFDNEYAVYMHGTPHQELFGKEDRFFSSGCIRLRDPDIFGQVVLEGNDKDWTVERIQSEIAKGKTRWLKVAEPLSLYVLYNTVFRGEDGAINFRRDAYLYDQPLADALKTVRDDTAHTQ